MVKYTYDAYGKCLSITGENVTIGTLNPFRYKGYYYDTESGMYYCKSRYYVPEWGRWLNYDRAEYLDLQDINGLNLYSYCCNNPINYIDKNGNSATLIMLFLLACTVLGSTIGAAKAYSDAKDKGITGSDLIWSTIKGIVLGGALGLAAGGFIVCLVAGIAAIGAFDISAVTVMGVSVKSAMGIGSLAINFAAWGGNTTFWYKNERCEYKRTWRSRTKFCLPRS